MQDALALRKTSRTTSPNKQKFAIRTLRRTPEPRLVKWAEPTPAPRLSRPLSLSLRVSHPPPYSCTKPGMHSYPNVECGDEPARVQIQPDDCSDFEHMNQPVSASHRGDQVTGLNYKATW
eukprot:5579678-Amphidinium_carterae.1